MPLVIENTLGGKKAYNLKRAYCYCRPILELKQLEKSALKINHKEKKIKDYLKSSGTFDFLYGLEVEN